MKHNAKLTPQQEQQLSAGHQTQQHSAREFGTVEELLRHDALHTTVPPAIAHRLQESIGSLPPAPRPWWRRLLG